MGSLQSCCSVPFKEVQFAVSENGKALEVYRCEDGKFRDAHMWWNCTPDPDGDAGGAFHDQKEVCHAISTLRQAGSPPCKSPVVDNCTADFDN